MSRRFLANCLIVALICGRTRMRTMRNETGRLHWYWLDREGRAWTFTDKGRGMKTYLQNALYVGSIRRYPACDIAPHDDDLVRLIGETIDDTISFGSIRTKWFAGPDDEGVKTIATAVLAKLRAEGRP